MQLLHGMLNEPKSLDFATEQAFQVEAKIEKFEKREKNSFLGFRDTLILLPKHDRKPCSTEEKSFNDLHESEGARIVAASM